MERISHRGAKRELPENSVPAFIRAVERGAQAIELDVHSTRDGEIVVHHDATLGQQAGALAGRAINELDWSELCGVELAPHVGIPTLADAFHAVGRNTTVYIEIKGTGMEPVLAGLLSASEHRCAVHSFDHSAVARMRRLVPDVDRGILLEHSTSAVEHDMQDTGARDVWPKWTLIDQRLVDRVHAAGGRVIAWTVNSRRVARTLRALGVDAICTDDVRLLANL